MNIAIITSGHSLYASRLFTKEAKSIQKKYDNISMIGPAGHGDKIVDGIHFINVPKYKSRYNRWKCLKTLYNKTISLNPDIVHCHELDSLIVGIFIKRKIKCKLIFDCHEVYPEVYAAKFNSFFGKIVLKFVAFFEAFLARYSDAVITVNESLVEKFQKVIPVVVNLPNYPLKDFLPLNAEPKKIHQRCELMYAGTISEDRGVLKMLDIIYKLNQNSSYDYFLTLAGSFSTRKLKTKFDEKLSRLKLDSYVDYKGKVSHDEVKDLLFKSHVGLFLIADKERYRWSAPIKFFEYSAYGLNIVMTDLPAKRRLIEEFDNGVLVNENDIDGICDQIRNLVSNQDIFTQNSKNGMVKIQEYCWESIDHRLIDLYDEINSRLDK